MNVKIKWTKTRKGWTGQVKGRCQLSGKTKEEVKQKIVAYMKEVWNEDVTTN